MDYANSKIYKITGGGMTYYGSTTQTLSKRMYLHKQKLNCSSKQIIELGNYDICLVELFPCKSKEELHMRERFYIENNKCINKCIPLQTPKEYYEKNKDKIVEWYKEYVENNKDKIANRQAEYRIINKDKLLENENQYRIKMKEQIKEKKKEKMTCSCGSIICKYVLPRHLKSQKHFDLMNDLKL